MRRIMLFTNVEMLIVLTTEENIKEYKSSINMYIYIYFDSAMKLQKKQ